MLEAIGNPLHVYRTLTDVSVVFVNHSRITSTSLIAPLSDRDEEKTSAPDAKESISKERREGPKFGSYDSTSIEQKYHIGQHEEPDLSYFLQVISKPISYRCHPKFFELLLQQLLLSDCVILPFASFR